MVQTLQITIYYIGHLNGVLFYLKGEVFVPKKLNDTQIAELVMKLKNFHGEPMEVLQ